MCLQHLSSGEKHRIQALTEAEDGRIRQSRVDWKWMGSQSVVVDLSNPDKDQNPDKIPQKIQSFGRECFLSSLESAVKDKKRSSCWKERN